MTIFPGALILVCGLAFWLSYGLLIKHIETGAPDVSEDDRETPTEFDEAMERYARIRPGRQS